MTPNLVDLLIAVLLIASVVTGLSAGLFAVLGSVSGVVLGALAAPWVLPLVARAVPDSEWRGLLLVLTALALLAIGATIGSAIGRLVRKGADKLKLRVVERLLGGVAAVAAAALAITMVGSSIASAGVPGLSATVASSTVLRSIERYIPAPVAEAAARLNALVFGESGLPSLQGLLQPGDLDAAPDAAPIELSTPELERAAGSVVKISGSADGCGVISSGTGFVVADDRILTNAHVVAGVGSPIVEVPGEPARDATVVYFDPVDDIAVVAADVAAAPLALSDDLGAGDGAAIMGYPFGGPFRVVSAGVISASSAPVEDIYGDRRAARSVYALRAQVEPGNSGGPLLTDRGQVAGMVFAKDAATENVGYAMTNAELKPVIAQVADASDRVSVGACIR
ncbi:MarP family serine protease [Microbacterium esteraromaticum]|uniref:MarP family serine protease n=1 Tax=Microbacterium esteraromaticum TaxID=57043 RepID=UPI00195B7A08|nr:MarP family serine protease [Microbacterium esteraromaticum]MBM7466531.1 S1-C subfamily serine protease [Microbacterium esteraromaticum]